MRSENLSCPVGPDAHTRREERAAAVAGLVVVLVVVTLAGLAVAGATFALVAAWRWAWGY
jgi:hypothetical protein